MYTYCELDFFFALYSSIGCISIINADTMERMNNLKY